MLTSLFIIACVTILLIALAKLHDANAELARMHDEAEQVARDDAAYVHAAAMSLAVLLAGLATFNVPPTEGNGK
jgi:hypothetical protein